MEGHCWHLQFMKHSIEKLSKTLYMKDHPKIQTSYNGKINKMTKIKPEYDLDQVIFGCTSKLCADI